MPIHVNLYHEVQRQELARQRDPLRLGMLGVLIIAIGFVVNYFIVLERAHEIGIRYTALEDQWSKIQPKAEKAKAREDELNSEIAASDAMIKSVDSRLYWAPILGQILRTVPRNVQLTHVSADAPSDEKAIYSNLSLSGISSAIEPRKEAEAVRTALNATLASRFKNVTSAFKSLDDGDQTVVLDGHSLATAMFTIDIQIQVRDPISETPPSTLVRRMKSAESE